ncbi:MAG: ABC transporter ATP-binding protein [Acidaminococcaceae bacterium]|jgi:sulfonate transport system ATP-binding protein|nr:ABC transporter ATP-binding protein [Acidaminococcaceae bacterium]
MLSLSGLSKSYAGKVALAPATLTFADHSFTCIVGKSGCGKTTLLRLIAGLEAPSAGTIALTGTARRIGIVFQEPRLMPWLTVAQNIAFADSAAPHEDPARLQKLLQQLELTEAASLYPRQLSGGMAQRVSLGRTLYYDPDIILMDEPFSALDYFTRRSLQLTLLQLYAATRKTILFVTHDVEEAVLLGDRVLVMASGAIQEQISINLPQPRQAVQVEIQSLRQRILVALSERSSS